MNTGNEGPGAARKPVAACPICGKPPTEKYRPFCSGRCADVDLHRWLSGSYVIPGTTEDDEDGDTPLAPGDPPGG